MKKRWMTGIICTALAVSAAVPALASEPDSRTDSTTLKAEVGSTFILTIPQTTDITYGEEKTAMPGSLKVTGNVDVGEQVQVTVQAEPLRNVSRNESIAYTVTAASGTGAFTGDTWSETELREASKEISLFVNITGDAWEQAKAGTYTGSVIFTAELRTETIQEP